MTQRIEVNIMGQGYVLASSDGDEHVVRAAAQRVDEAMCKVRDAGKIKARDRIAVLAGLNLAFELEQSQAHPPSQAAAAAPGSSELESGRLRELVAKLDRALGEDGRLL
ncbi:MAG: cell division protein ZapA [Burkholderiaceae bacterium]|jgi:cell division protein ZapA